MTYNARDFPPPRVPEYPVLSFRMPLGARRNETFGSIFDVGNKLLLTSGRVSIAVALKIAGVREGDSVLLPAFNCRAMVEPLRGLGIRPVYYKVNPDLSVDIRSIENLIDERTKALIVVHYFGFPQDMESIRAFCDPRNLVLIEDCAQCFFGSVNGRPPGAWGDYAIASLMKYFPVYDGGCVVSRCNQVDHRELQAGGLSFELKVLINILERCVRYRRMRPLNWLLWPVLKLKDVTWSWLKGRASPEERLELGPNASDGGFQFEAHWLNISMSLTSRAILRMTATGRIARRRRDIYRRFLSQLGDHPGCRPLHSHLPDTVVPYVFPLVVDSPEHVFPALKLAGVPIFRWEDIEPDPCAVSARYARSLLQFPCHHELRDGEVEWMIEKVQKALSD